MQVIPLDVCNIELCAYLIYSASKRRKFWRSFESAPFTHQKCRVFLWCRGLEREKRLYRCRGRHLNVYIPSHMFEETTPDNCCDPISDVPRHLHLTEIAPQHTVWLQLSVHYTWFLQLLSSTSNLIQTKRTFIHWLTVIGNVVGAH